MFIVHFSLYWVLTVYSVGWSEPKSIWGRTCRSSKVEALGGESLRSTHLGRWCRPVTCPGYLISIFSFSRMEENHILCFFLRIYHFRSLLMEFNGTVLSVCVRHINTVELQLEVTRFLYRCETAGSFRDSQTTAPSSKSPGSSSPPTLFSGSPMKVEVACKVRFQYLTFM